MTKKNSSQKTYTKENEDKNLYVSENKCIFAIAKSK